MAPREQLGLDVSGDHGVDSVNQQHRRQVLGQLGQLVQISLIVLLILRCSGQREEQDGRVSTFLPAQLSFDLSNKI